MLQLTTHLRNPSRSGSGGIIWFLSAFVCSIHLLTEHAASPELNNIGFEWRNIAVSRL